MCTYNDLQGYTERYDVAEVVKEIYNKDIDEEDYQPMEKHGRL